MKTRTKVVVLVAATVVLGAAGVHAIAHAIAAPPAGHGPGFAMGFMRDNGPHATGRAHGTAMGMGPGMAMRGADAAGPMRGARHGGDATASEMQGIHELFAKHDRINRTVTNLPNGIRALTESDDPQLAQTIKEHTVDMLKRVREKRDPGLPIESPALRGLFDNYDKIETKVETTEKGVVVTQTSDDATTVALLQKHAGEVSAFVEKGMQAVHDSMARNRAMPMATSGRGMMGRMTKHGNSKGPSGVPSTMHDHTPDQADPPAGTSR
jgi:hypothetical protein